ncbi:MAG: TIGR03620 family F420-dependent LLM class oxidoreductase [Acidimicrobiales bacterium]
MTTVSTWPDALEKLRGTIGIWTFAHETLPAPRSGDIAAELESLGYAAMWLPEAWGREAFTNAALMLRATSSMIIATGIANIWARDAVAANNAAKTLNAAFDDRFVLGLGVSHRPLVERLRGHDYATPVVAMREYLTAMEAAPMMAPEGELRFAKVIAALGPKMLSIGATLADGVHPYLVTPEHTADVRAAIGDKFIGVEQAVVLGQSREEFLVRAHAHLGFYTGLENYTNNWRRLGFSDEDFVRGGSERLCNALVVHGDEDAVLARVNEHRAAGADHVCLQVLSDETNTPPIDEWRRLSAILAS